VLHGNVESQFCNLPHSLHFNQRQHNIQYNTDFCGTHIIHTPEFHACTITYHTEYVKSFAESEQDEMLSMFSRHVHKKKNFLGAAHALQSQHQMTEIIASIRQCKFQGVTRYIFTESKLLELFVLQIEQVHGISSNKITADRWSAADKEKLYAVREFIDTAYLQPLSLKGLAVRFGLNEFKLKKGYKHFFQATVFGDIQRLRMQHAKQLLCERAMNATEAAYYIGYNDLSSFSYAFKKMFGVNPGSVC
jgi:AraC-like DNA-binding protein